MRYFVLFFSLPLVWLEACTGFQLTAQDGSRIYCRSLEFSQPLDSHLLIVPRSSPFVGSAPNQKKGIAWNVKYGYVGMNQSMAKTMVTDGMNEKGLVAASFYMPRFAKYESFNPARSDATLGAWELPSYLLATCSTVEEVKAALPKILVVEQPSPGMNGTSAPLHFYVADAKGQTIVIEYIGGRRIVHDNPLGVLTNSPPFDWHTTNLSNYVGLSSMNRPTSSLQLETIQPLGQGSGLLGLPGDFTPPSRFVRAALFSSSVVTPKDGQSAVLLGFHILNTFDLFEGVVRSEKGDIETTQWTLVHDMTRLKTYFRGYQSLQVQLVDLTKLDFTRAGLRQIALRQTFSVSDDTDKLTPLPK